MSPSGGSNGGSGITRSIRENLNFNDDKKWKEFSNRRLELIDKYSLSSKKASDQDDDIKQIADILRNEFGFPPETLNDFDKLVRAAIQSVRRNRKRISRARVNNDRFIVVDEHSKSSSPTLSTSSIGNISSTTLFQPMHNYNNLLFNNHHRNDVKNDDSNSHTHKNINRNANNTPKYTSPSHSLNVPATILPSINKLKTGPISATTPSLATIQSSSSSPSLIPSSLQGTNNPSSLSIGSSSKQKLLSYIQKSRSCLLLSNNDPSIHGNNLMNLGRSIIESSISFVLERFFYDISAESINYLYEKLNTSLKLSQILKSLGYLSTDVMILSDSQASNLLSKLIGCCVKDFGFDAIGYTIGEIFHEIILNEYPLVSTQVVKLTQESLYTPLLPMVPQEADSEVVKEVHLKFGTRTLEFKYTPLSSAPPTYLELVENGKIGFGIDRSKNIRLKWNDTELLDLDISKIFKDLSLKRIDIELYEVGRKIINGGLNFTRLA